MNKTRILQLLLLIASVLLITTVNTKAVFYVPPLPVDTDPDTDGDGIADNDIVGLHMAASDGFVNMADGRLQYMFGFSDAAGIDPNSLMNVAMLGAEFPGPTIRLREGQQLYLTLSNIGMVVRPDLFDPHTIHWHGFPQAASIFDGVPDASISINMMSSLTYYYNVVEPGTFMWHCHVEAAEHMQMGMLANLYVEPIQNMSAPPGVKYVYNDGDGSTAYTADKDFPIQIASFDPNFHDASLNVQPLPFAAMADKYPMLNGRGYPDTVNPLPIFNTASDEGFMDRPSQKISALITAEPNQKILLRISSLSTTSYHTLRVLGIPMYVVGNGSRILRGADILTEASSGPDLYYQTASVTLGGGESVDVILDTTDIPLGTYFLYATNLDHLNNNKQDFGGMMTEIRIAAPIPVPAL